MSKYNNRLVPFDGYTFGSSAEAQRYGELTLLEKAGQIHALRVHPRYVVVAAWDNADGVHEPAIRYEADFEFIEGNEIVIEDVKGAETREWKIKWRLARMLYPDRVWRVIKV